MIRDGFMPTKLFYDPADVVAAAKLLLVRLSCWNGLNFGLCVCLQLARLELPMPSEAFKYDVIDVTRQVFGGTLLLLG